MQIIARRGAEDAEKTTADSSGGWGTSLRWWLSLFWLIGCLATASAAFGAGEFSGQKAYDWTGKAVALGPRPPGSPAITKLQGMILAELKAQGWQVTDEAFQASTPMGPKTMHNLIGRLPGKSGKVVVFSGHYDTKVMEGFVGANDAGSSTGMLLELARVLPSLPRRDDVILAFFDGEEAFRFWTDTDSLYGSRYQAQKWQKDRTLSKIKALFNIDMVGDRDLKIIDEGNSSGSLRSLVRASAIDLGYQKHFLVGPQAIEDDHMPFIRMGVPAVDLIDFEYGPNNSWWHTPQDTMDKLSPKSFQVVGDVLVEVFKRLQR